MGEFYALSCALVWAGAVIFFRKSGESVPPFTLNFFRVSISSLMFLASLAAMGRPLLNQGSWTDILILMASGVISIAVSDTFFHMCLNRVGAGLNAIVSSLYSPFIVLFAFFMLGEKLGVRQFAGMGLIIGGVLVASRSKPPAGTNRRTLVTGILYGMLAMATLGFGIVLAKPVLTRSDVLWATTVRQLGAWVAMILVLFFRKDRRLVLEVFRPNPAWRFSLPGTVLGSYVALILWIAGMKYTATGTAGILNQSSTLFILILATWILKEPFSRRKGASVFLTLGGILLTLV
ncbi:MAG: DMT family transporter [Gemmatimonadales bacterium]|nr:DMT family transporter [Gemmatimonadales bacterium]